MALRSAAVAFALVAFALAGCSDGDGGSGDGPGTSAPGTTPASPSPSASSSTSTTSASGTTTPPPGPQTVQKDIRNNAFPDGTFAVRAGDTVVWTQRDAVPHSVTADGGAFDSNPVGCPPACMVQGQAFSHTFEAAGTFDYHCKVHPSMTGTVTVA